MSKIRWIFIIILALDISCKSPMKDQRYVSELLTLDMTKKMDDPFVADHSEVCRPTGFAGNMQSIHMDFVKKINLRAEKVEYWSTDVLIMVKTKSNLTTNQPKFYHPGNLSYEADLISQFKKPEEAFSLSNTITKISSGATMGGNLPIRMFFNSKSASGGSHNVIFYEGQRVVISCKPTAPTAYKIFQTGLKFHANAAGEVIFDNLDTPQSRYKSGEPPKPGARITAVNSVELDAPSQLLKGKTQLEVATYMYRYYAHLRGQDALRLNYINPGETEKKQYYFIFSDDTINAAVAELTARN